MDKTSRLPGFYNLSVEQRAARVADWAGLDEAERAVLAGAGLTAERADQMIENVVGLHGLPLGIAANFPGQWPRLSGPHGHRGAVGGGRRQLHGPDCARRRRVCRPTPPSR